MTSSIARPASRFSVIFIALSLALSAMPGAARAGQTTLPPSLAPLILAETVPFTFTPNGYAAADYRLEWLGQPVPGVSFRLGERSLDWVRVLETLDLPRAVAHFEVSGADGGSVSSAGFSQPLLAEGGRHAAALPVALISGPENPIEVTVQRDGRELKGTVVVRLSPRPGNESQILVDSTCSTHRVSADSKGARPDSFVYLGCRYVHTLGDKHPVPSLELFVYWDGVGQTIDVEGVPRKATSVSTWAIRLRSDPGSIRLKAGKHELVVHYSIPPRLRRGSLRLGIGPYGYTFQGGTDDVGAIAPIATLYGSYFLSEQMRVVAFNATAIHSKPFTNQGFYLWAEQMRVFDSRFSMVLLFGAHALGFSHRGSTYLRVGGPQGIEFNFKDFLARRHDVGFGAFLQPPLVSDKFYYNAWVRWGSPEWFVEFNYISWLELIRDERVYSRSIGISIGFPSITFM